MESACLVSLPKKSRASMADCCIPSALSGRKAVVELGDVVEVNEVFHIYNYAAGGQGLAFSNGTLVSVPVTELNRYVVAHPVPSLRWKFFLEHENGHALDEAELLFWNWCITRSSALPLNDLCAG